MLDYEFSQHAVEMLNERKIRKKWVELAVSDPEQVVTAEDGTTHYIKTIDDFGGRVLRVVVNAQVVPPRIVTLFLDRRLRRTK